MLRLGTALLLQILDALGNGVPVLHNVVQGSLLKAGIVVLHMAVHNFLDGTEVEGRSHSSLLDEIAGLLVDHLAVDQQFPVVLLVGKLVELRSQATVLAHLLVLFSTCLHSLDDSIRFTIRLCSFTRYLL